MARRASTSQTTSPATVARTRRSVQKQPLEKQENLQETHPFSTKTISQWESPLRIALDKLLDEHTYRKRDGFSISSIGDCAARQLFSVAGFTQGNRPAARTLLTWRAGNDGETEIYRLLEQVAGYTIVGKQKEVIGASPPREGHMDGMVLLDDGRLWLFDAKTANARSFDEWIQQAGLSKWASLRDGLVRYDPRLVPGSDYRPVRSQYPNYYYQAQGYLELVNNRDEYKQYRIDNIADPNEKLVAAATDGAVPIAGDGFYFYVYCKDDSRLYEEFVPYDGEVIEPRLAKLDTAYRKVLELKEREEELKSFIRKQREVEKKEDGSLHWKCKRCPFLEICWE